MKQAAERTPCTACVAEPLGAAQGRGGVCAIIVAGGGGRRFGNPHGKQFVSLAGMPVVCWSVLAADRAPSVHTIVVVAPVGRVDEMRMTLEARLCLRHPVIYAESGYTRQDSVAHGLACVPEDCDFIAVHDGARPLARSEDFEACATRLRCDATLTGTIVARPSIDTLKVVEGETVVTTPDRSFYWYAQTPQMFRRGELLAAYDTCAHEGYEGTDDASLVEHCGGRIVCIKGSGENLKITVPEDLVIAEALLTRRLAAEGCGIFDDGSIRCSG